MDGEDASKIDKDRGYTSLPMDVRVELLEEALLNAQKRVVLTLTKPNQNRIL